MFDNQPNNSLQRYLLLRLAIIIGCLTLLFAALMVYLLLYSHDDSAEYYLQYEALTLTEHYPIDADIAEFDPQIKEYYWRQSQLPDKLQRLIAQQKPIKDKLNWYQSENFDIYVYPHRLDQNQTFWVVHYFLTEDLGEGYYFKRNLVLMFGLLFIGLLLLSAMMLSLSISKQLKRFADWVGQLQTKPSQLQPPEFDFSELQQAAFLLASSITTERQLQFEQQQQVKREKSFLSTLSHELRTPMAVINAAIALLQKRNDLAQKDVATLNKLASANEKMKLLSTVLLSLWRKQHHQLPIQSVNLLSIIEQAIETAKQQKPLALSINIELDVEKEIKIEGNEALLQLIFDNLLRNASQYALDGQAQMIIDIKDQQLHRVEVSNLTADELQTGDDYGFGLGLYLVAEICQQQHWLWNTQLDDNCFTARVTF